jgi:MFS family permease
MAAPRTVVPGAMLAILTAAFLLSNVYRTLPAILAASLAAEFDLSAGDIGLFAASFHVAFALPQLAIGVALDRYGPRRTVGYLLILTCLGSALCAIATSLGVLVLGQALTGFGCSAALMGAFVFVTRWYGADRFAAISGRVMAAGGLGMLVSGTPLAWVVATLGWRAVYVLLVLVSAVVTASCLAVVRDAPPEAPAPKPTRLRVALKGVLEVLQQAPAAGIVLLGVVAYPMVLTLRGVWIGPLLAERYSLSLVASGNAITGLSLAMVVGPILFGRIDPGEGYRRPLMAATALLMTGCIGWVAYGRPDFLVDYIVLLVFGVASGFSVLQYADVQSVYPPRLAGRAFALLNMAVFVGIAVMQWGTGALADLAQRWGANPITVALAVMMIAVVLGTAAFVCLPSRIRPEIE